MNKELFRILDCDETVKKSLPDIINAFAVYYGVSTEEVEKKFSQVSIVGVITPEELKRNLQNIRKNIFNELLDKMLDNLGYVDTERNEMKRILFAGYTFDYQNLFPIDKYATYIKDKEAFTNYRREEVVEFLRNFDENVNASNLNALIDSGAFSFLGPILEQYEMMKKHYKERIEGLKPYQEYVDKSLKLKDELEDREKDQLYLEFIDLIPQNERELSLLEEKRTGHKIGFSMDVANSVVGLSLSYESKIEAFSEENSKLLLSGGWRADSIKRDRISFFKSYGIDLGNNYEDYLNNESCKKLIPNEELVQRIKQRRGEAYNRYLNNYINSLDGYVKTREKIDRLGLLDKNDGINAKAYLNSRAFVSPNLVKKDGNYQLHSILCLNLGSLLEYLDSALLHELNHVYELSLLSASESEIKVTSGWDVISERFSDKEDVVDIESDGKKRSCELLNEIINEIICQEIHELMLSNEKTIFNEPNTTKIHGGTSYENMLFLVKDFYRTYSKEIKESRKNGRVEYLFDVVGEENFNALSELLQEFYEQFPTGRYFKAMDDLANKKDSKEINDLKLIIAKRDEILKKMQEYSEAKKSIVVS